MGGNEIKCSKNTNHKLRLYMFRKNVVINPLMYRLGSKLGLKRLRVSMGVIFSSK